MSVNNTLISIVIPCYNHGNYLENSVNSIIDNCSYSYEIIIVNDGSTDNTKEILENYKDNANIITVNQANAGVSNALNAGFKLAKGNFLTWSSADNLYKNKALDKLLNFLVLNPDIDLVYSDVELIDEKSKTFKNSDYRIQNQDKTDSSKLRLPRQANTLSLYSDNFINACFLYRRWVFDIIGGYDERYIGYEDYDYWLKILACGTISHIQTNDILYSYRLHRNSLTSKLDLNQLQENQKKLVKKYHDIISDYLVSESFIASNKDTNKIESKRETNHSLESFLVSLPLEYEYIKHRLINNKCFNFISAIKTPQILSRTRNSDFKSIEHKNKLKCTLFLPSFITSSELENISKLIKSNSKITFMALALNKKQKTLADDLNLKLKKANKNYRIVDISAYKEKETLLTQEKYLPFIYALSNSDLMICPVIDSLKLFYSYMSIASITSVKPVFLSSIKCIFETSSYDKFTIKTPEVNKNWYQRVSLNKFNSKISRISHFLNYQKRL